jgi:hypothetical protein
VPPGPLPPAGDVARPRGLRGQMGRLRELATDHRRPLGSPEGNAAPGTRRPRSSSTPESGPTKQRLRRVVDSSALSVRATTKGLDKVLGKRTGRDWVATPQECFDIGAPVAAELNDRYDSSALAATVIDRSSLIAAAAGLFSYLLRVLIGQPGGGDQEKALEERVARRLERAADAVAEEPVAEAPAGARGIDDMFAEMGGIE